MAAAGVDRDEGRVAAVLAELFSSDPWSLFAAPGALLADASTYAKTAVRLYDVAAPVERANAGSSERGQFPATVAAAVVADLADGYAASLSPLDDEDRVVLPTRAIAEWWIRAHGVMQWARDLGHPLPLRSLRCEEPPPRELFASVSSDEGSALDEATTVRLVDMAVSAYDMCLGVHSGEFARSLGSKAAVSGMGPMIMEARRGAALIRDSFGGELDPVGAALLYIVRSCFVMQWCPDRHDVLYPRETLRALLNAFDSMTWLVDHGFQPPEWLS